MKINKVKTKLNKVTKKTLKKDKAKENISIIVPAFNERRGIAKVVENIKKAMQTTSYNYELIVVDDGSRDGTAEILNKIKEKENIRVITHPYNKGYGRTLKDGIKAAKNETIVMLDADDTYEPLDIPRLLEYKDNYDLITGARVGKKVKIPLLRRPAKFMLTSLANILTSRKIPDLNCGLRVIKKSNVTKFFYILPEKFSFTITHLLSCLSNGYNVKFLPIRYYHRKGTSTIHPIKDFIKFLNIIIRIVTYFNPFRMFSLVSFSLLGIAFLVWLYTIIYFGKIADITVIVLVLSALQIFLFGLLADLIIKSNKKNE